MKSFGQLLRTQIERSGYTNYGIAKRAGINRTTLQKILSDERSASREQVELLLPYLKLTPREEDEIYNLLERIQIGETVYSQRLRIKEMLEYTSTIISGDLSSPLPTAAAPDPSCAAPSDSLQAPLSDLLPDFKSGQFRDGMLFDSIYATEHLVNELLLTECQQTSPTLLVNFPANSPLFSSVFLHGIRYCPGISSLNVVHLTHFISDTGQPDSALLNLDLYAKVLPFIALSRFHYHVYYYYSRQQPSTSIKFAFPYYMVFSNAVVLLSADGRTAMPCFQPETVEHFRNCFEATLRSATPLVNMYPTAAHILEHVILTDLGNHPLYCMEYQPCLITYLTDSMIQSYARSLETIPEELMSGFQKRLHQLKKMNCRISIFSKSGLLDFVHTGHILEIPETYMSVLSPADRIEVLGKLYDEIAEDLQPHLMVNPVLFPISRQLSCILHQGVSLEFTGHFAANRDYCYVQTTEQTLLEAFSDFFKCLRTSPYVYTKETTLDYIKQCMQSLA